MTKYTDVRRGKRTGQGYEKVVYPDGEINYTLNDKRHKEDGPAVIKPNGYQAWYINGKVHREDGPAVIWPNSTKEYWLNDILVIPQRYHQFSPLQLAKLGLI